MTEETPDKIESLNYTDSICNVIIIGDLTLKSPNVEMKQLIQYALAILKNETAMKYLDDTKIKKLKGGYVG